jgi:hypothetical protein
MQGIIQNHNPKIEIRTRTERANGEKGEKKGEKQETVLTRNLENPISKECLYFEAGLSTLRGYYVTVTKGGRMIVPCQWKPQNESNKICREGEGEQGPHSSSPREKPKTNKENRAV